ncbi:MAG: dihydrodipicolinate reductase [Aquabacterium sp.]|nr:dihydrodipicolinate reductase [Aquabacterium sp.]MBP6614752.1 dihydrodipicolinate reductase [Aquabacterium sp.]MBP7501814.1 dihydrodipicolinate reductase [Aquabacterium sp.]
MKVGLIGYGKAGQAVAEVLKEDPRFELVWVAKRNPWPEDQPLPLGLPVFAMSQGDFGEWLDAHPVDALVDFSDADTIHLYGEEVRKRHLTLVSAISAYSDESLAYARSLGEQARVLCSPNITLGINFLILSARMLRGIAPFADVEILEQHFREKPEMSGTARKIAKTLDLDHDRITSLRLGGIVGLHEVIFGFPHQTVRITHESIRREAFGTGAAFALGELSKQPYGFYTFDDLLMTMIREQLTQPETRQQP